MTRSIEMRADIALPVPGDYGLEWTEELQVEAAKRVGALDSRQIREVEALEIRQLHETGELYLRQYAERTKVLAAFFAEVRDRGKL